MPRGVRSTRPMLVAKPPMPARHAHKLPHGGRLGGDDARLPAALFRWLAGPDRVANRPRPLLSRRLAKGRWQRPGRNRRGHIGLVLEPALAALVLVNVVAKALFIGRAKDPRIALAARSSAAQCAAAIVPKRSLRIAILQAAIGIVRSTRLAALTRGRRVKIEAPHVRGIARNVIVIASVAREAGA